jgi:nucleoid DNA-binding protein
LIQQKQKLAKNKEAAEVRTPKGIMAKVPAQRRVSFSVENKLKSIVNNK